MKLDINTLKDIKLKQQDLDIFLKTVHKEKKNRQIDKTRRTETEGTIQTILKIPLLLFVLMTLIIELTVYLSLRQAVFFYENSHLWVGKFKALRKKLKRSKTYEEWKRTAIDLDSLLGKEQWKNEPESFHYDHQRLLQIIKESEALLQKIDLAEDPTELLRELMHTMMRGNLINNIANWENKNLYTKTYYGTKKLIEQYIKITLKCIDKIGSSNFLSSTEKSRFFETASAEYGNTALCLSGGGAAGYYHLGVCKALTESDSIPTIITGTSAGSLLAALVACRTKEELSCFFTPDIHVLLKVCEISFRDKLKNLYYTKALFDISDWASKLQWVTLGNTTFLEAFKKTGKVLNISMVPYNSYSSPKLFNYKNAPDCVVWTAILASCAIPGILSPVTLLKKTNSGQLMPYLEHGSLWRDGSLKTDVPLQLMNISLKANFTIVSQVNPHISIFFYQNRGNIGNPSLHRSGHGWRGGFIASFIEHYLKLELKKWLKLLRDLELIPWFFQQDWSYLWLQKFDGNVTILPKFAIWDYYFLRDPDYNSLKNYLEKGQYYTWPSLYLINMRLSIEKRLKYWMESSEQHK